LFERNLVFIASTLFGDSITRGAADTMVNTAGRQVHSFFGTDRTFDKGMPMPYQSLWWFLYDTKSFALKTVRP
jgi:hypothetical protein